MKVYDARQDREKTLFHKLYEGLAGGVAKLLENTPRDEVATRTDVSGPLEKPRSSTWQTVVNLITNASLKRSCPALKRDPAMRPLSFIDEVQPLRCHLSSVIDSPLILPLNFQRGSELGDAPGI